jgi:hypothetical protein
MFYVRKCSAVLFGRKSRNLTQAGSVYLANITAGAVRCLPFPSISHSSLSLAGSILPVFGGDGRSLNKGDFKVILSTLSKLKLLLWRDVQILKICIAISSEFVQAPIVKIFVYLLAFYNMLAAHMPNTVFMIFKRILDLNQGAAAACRRSINLAIHSSIIQILTVRKRRTRAFLFFSILVCLNLLTNRNQPSILRFIEENRLHIRYTWAPET